MGGKLVSLEKCKSRNLDLKRKKKKLSKFFHSRNIIIDLDTYLES